MANDQDPVFEWVLHAYGTIKRGLIDAFADWSQSKKKLQETTIFCHKPHAPFAS
jgi:hypothetical protein